MLGQTSTNGHHYTHNVPGIDLLPCAIPPGFNQSSLDPHNFASNDEEYMTRQSVAETTPGESDHAPCCMTATRM